MRIDLILFIAAEIMWEGAMSRDTCFYYSGVPPK